MTARLLRASPALVCALALGAASERWSLALGLLGLSLLLALLDERWEVDRGRQLVASVVGGVVGYGATAALFEQVPGRLTESWTKLTATLLMAGSARFALARARGGREATIALLFASLLAAGEARSRGVYPALVAAFLGCALATMRADDRDRAPLLGSPRTAALAAVIALATLGLGATGTIGTRQLHAFFLRRSRSSFQWKPRTGFSDTMELGALDGLLDSDTVVLRVRGPRVDFLRGAAFDVYEAGGWTRSDEAAREGRGSWAEEPRGAVEIEAASDQTDRLFLPLAARAVTATPPQVRVDALGAVKRDARTGELRVRFDPAPRTRAIPAPPGPHDLQMTRGTRLALQPLAASWAGDAASATAKLDAFERHLAAEYRYSRSFQRSLSGDPTLEFLFTDKRGHCEYFASALTLVARAAGIPARLVTGYRVAEQNPLGDYRIVREKHAHAWVEAWIDGAGWTTRDPTPPGLLAQDRPHDAGLASAIVDELRIGYDRAIGWLGRRSIAETAAASLVGLLALLAILARGARGALEKPRPLPDDEKALPSLEALLAALASSGYARGENEPLEQLAARVPDEASARLLRRYAALRYGGVGEPGPLAAEMIEYARRLGTR